MKARLTDEHQHILSIVAFKTDLTMDTVLDFIVENEEVSILCKIHLKRQNYLSKNEQLNMCGKNLIASIPY